MGHPLPLSHTAFPCRGRCGNIIRTVDWHAIQQPSDLLTQSGVKSNSLHSFFLSQRSNILRVHCTEGIYFFGPTIFGFLLKPGLLFVSLHLETRYQKQLLSGMGKSAFFTLSFSESHFKNSKIKSQSRMKEVALPLQFMLFG